MAVITLRVGDRRRELMGLRMSCFGARYRRIVPLVQTIVCVQDVTGCAARTAIEADGGEAFSSNMTEETVFGKHLDGLGIVIGYGEGFQMSNGLNGKLCDTVCLQTECATNERNCPGVRGHDVSLHGQDMTGVTFSTVLLGRIER
ncbi:MAG: hypothetical protein IPK19_31475 [Chloroflexi bacterium]|nr:hypothetical protein [Chloroflexota bacterium]